MWLVSSFALFGIFAGNLIVGSTLRVSLLGDVGEMLTLSAATICFVVAILQMESDTSPKKPTKKSMGENNHEKRI